MGIGESAASVRVFYCNINLIKPLFINLSIKKLKHIICIEKSCTFAASNFEVKK